MHWSYQPQTLNQLKMNIKQFSLGALAGAVTLFILGFLLYVVLLPDFMEANMGSATGVMRSDTETIMPLIFLGQLFTACLLTYVYLRWAGISTFVTGLKAGLVIGIFMTLGYNLVSYATTNIANLTMALVDAVLYAIVLGIAGGVIGLVLGKLKN